MSQRAALNTTDIRGALERAISLTRHVTVRQAWYELGWRWPALVAGLLLVDLVGSGPAWFRWIGLVAMAGYPAIAILNIRERLAKRSYPEEHAARLVEQGHPELNNALINAVQFQRVVEGVSAAQAGLMRREISRAENAVATTSIDGVVDRAGERRARILLFGVIGAWLAGAAIFPGVVGAILPRLFAPWMDDVTPPFSLTKLDISPKGASVRYGGALVVSVALQGPVPESLSLATRSAKGTWSDVPLESTEPGKYAVTLSALRDDTWIVAHAGTPAAWGGGARSGRYLIKVVQPPTAEALQATYSYPAYTGQKELTEQVGEPGIHGLRDTKVRLQITANREVTGGEVVLESKDAPDQHFGIQISDRNARIAVAAFPITASGTFRVALASGDEQVNSDAAQGKVVLERDQRPNVWFNEPPSEIVVTPDMKVGLEIEADDDIGVARIDLHRVINGIADNAAAVYRGQPVKRIGNRLVMDMADLGVRPGDEITYYADAFDNDPGHPNYAETDPYKIRVSSPEAYKKLLKDQRDVEKLSQEASDMQSALNSLAERQQDLADKMEKFAKELAKRPGDPGLKQQTAAAQQEQKKLQAEAQQMAKRLEEYAKSPSGSAIESALKKKIGEAAQGVANAANQAMKAAASGDPGRGGAGRAPSGIGTRQDGGGGAKVGR